jgi:hypothetical protein
MREPSMTLNNILVTIGLIALVIYAIFNILYLIDLRKTSVAMRQFIAKTDENLNPALTELRYTLAEIRKLTGDISITIEKLRTAASAIISVEKIIEHLYGYYREGFSQSAQGLRAGFKAGVISLVKNLKRKKDGPS